MEDFVENNNRYKLLNSVKNCRKKTCDLIENLEIDDLIIQTENYVSPIKWHLGHTSWFFRNLYYQIFVKTINFSIKITILYLIHIMRLLVILTSEKIEVI